MNNKQEPDYHDYVIKDGKFIGKFEEMYQNVEDPWHHGNATAKQYTVCLELLKRYQKNEKIKILDIGCSKGPFTARLKNEYPDSEITGIDISPTAIRKAREKYGYLDIEFRVGDILKDQIGENGPYDIIIVSQIFWYVLSNIKEVINKIKDALKDEGYVLINQAFYDPKKQKYGKDILQTELDIIKLFGIEVMEKEIIRVEGSDDYSAVLLLKKIHRR